jgi:hypothetical protein
VHLVSENTTSKIARLRQRARARGLAVAGAAAAGLGHTVRLGRISAVFLPGLAGAGLVSWGAWMAWHPAGLIAAGTFCLACDRLLPAPGREGES